MLESVTGQSLYTQFIMDRLVDSRPMMLVEGDDECHLIDPHLDRSKFRTVPAHGKKNVVNAMSVFAEHGEGDDVLFIVDSDFDELGDVHPCKHVSKSLAYDLEAEVILFHKSVARALIMAHCRRERMSPVSDGEVAEVHENAMRLAALVGALRWLALRDGMSVPTSGIPFGELLRAGRKGSAIQKLRRIVRSRFEGVVPPAYEIRKVANDRRDSVVRGHDALGAMVAIIGARRGKMVVAHDFRSAFHSTVSSSIVEKLSLHEPAVRWANEVKEAYPWLVTPAVGEDD